MAYQTYITDAIVVGSYQSNAADKSFLLFTERAGLVYATARSVREERSRQRYALQDFSHITVTLVKGKASWRIGSVDVYDNFFHTATNRAARGSIVKLVKVIRRYVHGETPEPALYHELLIALRHLGQTALLERAAYEYLATVRLLRHLGYVAPPLDLETMFSLPFPNIDATSVGLIVKDLERLLEGAQGVSHLE
jgi:DNA repair protein RecO